MLACTTPRAHPTHFPSIFRNTAMRSPWILRRALSVSDQLLTSFVLSGICTNWCCYVTLNNRCMSHYCQNIRLEKKGLEREQLVYFFSGFFVHLHSWEQGLKKAGRVTRRQWSIGGLIQRGSLWIQISELKGGVGIDGRQSSRLYWDQQKRKMDL